MFNFRIIFPMVLSQITFVGHSPCPRLRCEQDKEKLLYHEPEHKQLRRWT